MHDQFVQIVNDSPFLAEKWKGLVADTVAQGEKYFGVTLTEAQVMDLTSVRVAAMGAPLDEEEFRKELAAHPAMAETIRARRFAAGGQEARQSALEEVNAIPGLSARITRARELGVTTTHEDTSSVNKADALKLILALKPGQRLAVARQLGLA